MKRIYSVMFFFFLLALTSLHAQIHVKENGSVALGIEEAAPHVKLHITEDGLAQTGTNYLIKLEYAASSTREHYGVYSTIIPSDGYGTGGYFKGGATGIYSYATSSSGGNTSRIGVYSNASNGSSSNYGTLSYGYFGTRAYGVYGRAVGGVTSYGVYGYATGGTTNYGVYGYASTSSGYAGYFQGNVWCNELVEGSDEKLKRNIQDLDKSMLTKLKKVKSRSYEFRTDEYSGLPKGKKYGFVAQELEEVFPELVSTSMMPSIPNVRSEASEEGINNDNKEIPEEGITTEVKGINYTGMIPILVEAIQEQQAQIEKLEAKLAALEGK